jgi:GH15 family glucan-1,4-alpha-glucosidase
MPEARSYPLIEDYALIGDMQSAALVNRDGAVDWLCLPRFDSDAVFAALVGDRFNGQWRLHPTASSGGPPARRGEVERGYVGDTLILSTVWRMFGGSVRVTDFMPPRDGSPPVLIRIVEGVEGAVEMECVIRLRFGYGRIVPWVRRIDHAIRAVAGPDSVWLHTPVKLVGRDMAHRATFTVRGGDRLPFTLSWQPSHVEDCPRVDAGAELARTTAFWSAWVGRCGYHGQYREPVIRSLITLKALTYAPTGGIVAAPTTSLPEDIGGVRNWDYRYCWLRDATIALEALLRTGYTEEAAAWSRWLGRAVAGSTDEVQIMYGVGGERRLTEWRAGWLEGYERSTPVRIGNAAVDQRQLDVYGEVIDAFVLGRQAGLDIDRHTAGLTRALLRFVEKHWDEPDEGIWEVRGPRRHFVHSKVMAWVAFDRAVQMAQTGMPGTTESDVRRWRAARDAVHAQVCEQGYDAGRGTFTQYYGSSELDAAVLMIPEVGFLPPDDQRVVSTVRTIRRELVRDGLVLRYSLPQSGSAGAAVDGLPGGEGAFLACSFWLVNALQLIGECEEASALFGRLLALRSDLGLLSEEYDPRYGRQVGNTPQAFSHMALIQAAMNLEDHALVGARRKPATTTWAGPGTPAG